MKGAPKSIMWERAEESVPTDGHTPYKCPLCSSYNKSGWSSECPSRANAITNLFRHLQNHRENGEGPDRSDIPPKHPQKNKRSCSQQRTPNPPTEDDSDSSSDYEQENTQTSSSMTSEAETQAQGENISPGPCDSESSEGELAATPRTPRTSANYIVPRRGDEPYRCPLCTNYNRPGWNHFVSRSCAISSLNVHLLSHTRHTKASTRSHNHNHHHDHSTPTTLSDKLVMLTAALTAPVYTEGAAPGCLQSGTHYCPKKQEHQNVSVREAVDILCILGTLPRNHPRHQNTSYPRNYISGR
ncbi:hypothetical protein Pelo_16370, partial [Pelomyxa schiedti]